MIPIELIVLAACILAGIGRAGLPYLRKLKEAEETGSTVEFERKYLFTAIFSIVVSSIAGLLIYPAVFESVPIGGSLFVIFITAFGFAWGTNDIFNQIMATGSSLNIKKPEDQPQPTQ